MKVQKKMKISLIVPAYNSASTIGSCIESVLKQTGAEIEIIVVNDGSSDNTAGVLEAYGDRIRVINQKNTGVAGARNTGLQNATGDFLMFLDADDYLDDGAIARISEKQREHDADIVRFQYVTAYKNGTRVRSAHSFEKEEFIKKEEFPQKIYPYFINSIRLNSVCMNMIKRTVVENVRFRSDMETAEDAVFCVEAYTNAKNVLILPDEFYIYNRTDGSITGNGLSVKTKYKCNFILSGVIIRHLPSWGMNSPYIAVKAALRPFVITLDKIKRVRHSERNSQ